MLLWPAMTILTAIVFRVSFRQAGIRFGHVARCVVYSMDTLLIAVALVAVVGNSSWITPMWQGWPVPLMAFLVIVGVRFMLSVTLYLRIRGGVAMVLASQIMVWLATAKLSLMVQGF
jgi:hypothetical protein